MAREKIRFMTLCSEGTNAQGSGRCRVPNTSAGQDRSNSKILKVLQIYIALAQEALSRHQRAASSLRLSRRLRLSGRGEMSGVVDSRLSQELGWELAGVEPYR